MTSAVLIVPAAYVDAAEGFGQSRGWGPDNFTVPLSSNGGASVTHYGCRADPTPEFIADCADPGPEAAPLVAVMVIDFSADLWGLDHFMAVIEAHGMVRV